MSDIVWLSLDEAAGRLGITRESARRLARRKRWGKRPGNDGLPRIGVPVERLSRQDLGQTPGPDLGQDPGHPLGRDLGQEHKVAILSAEIEGLKALVAEARNRADAADKRADAADKRADEIRQERVVQVAALNALVEEMRRDRDHWREAAVQRRSWWPFRRTA